MIPCEFLALITCVSPQQPAAMDKKMDDYGLDFPPQAILKLRHPNNLDQTVCYEPLCEFLALITCVSPQQPAALDKKMDDYTWPQNPGLAICQQSDTEN